MGDIDETISSSKHINDHAQYFKDFGYYKNIDQSIISEILDSEDGFQITSHAKENMITKNSYKFLPFSKNYEIDLDNSLVSKKIQRNALNDEQVFIDAEFRDLTSETIQSDRENYENNRVDSVAYSFEIDRVYIFKKFLVHNNITEIMKTLNVKADEIENKVEKKKKNAMKIINTKNLNRKENRKISNISPTTKINRSFPNNPLSTSKVPLLKGIK